ncbi:hypothetical protein [Alteromonas lipotrueae]|uniref:hypothetical protein n=1 Tax=Alteromonas lipotrueae TaxID=2803814 RepID=UPI001C437650|nr:hypothetical protein [Alteromonas lipotrueae]
MDKIFNSHPHHALRAAFHFPNGDTDTRRAADFFCVSQRTIQHWMVHETLPDWAVKLLSIHMRGYLPHNDEWKGFHVVGNKIHFNGFYGAREVSARQLMALDFALPSTSDMKNSIFWDKFLKKERREEMKKRAH